MPLQSLGQAAEREPADSVKLVFTREWAGFLVERLFHHRKGSNCPAREGYLFLYKCRKGVYVFLCRCHREGSNWRSLPKGYLLFISLRDRLCAGSALHGSARSGSGSGSALRASHGKHSA